MKIPWEVLKDMITVEQEEIINYIYCYINKLNQHKYVGQTNNLQRRIREHRSCSFNQNASSYNDLIHKKIREYGEDNFEITVLEKIYHDNQKEVNDRETYWIKKLHTYCDWGEGYNQDMGGSRKYESSILTKNQIKEVKEKIKNSISFYDIEQEYKISPSFISAINHGTYFFDEQENYPLCKYYKNDKDYDELIDLLLNSNLTLAEIAKQLEIGYSTVKKINAGTLRNGLYPTYPIRKISARQQRANQIINLLINTSMTYNQIGEATGASNETIRRINVGQTFKDESLSYPLRNL